MTIAEESEIGDTRVHVRGSVHNLGESAPRGFLRVAFGRSPGVSEPRERSPRARRVARRQGQPALTARVMANRAWHWLFGAGIVRTTDNFGTTGEAPSHPELLDDLAVRFMEDGWSIKSLVRRIVLSRAYRLSTADDPQALAADPENRLLWRMNRRAARCRDVSGTPSCRSAASSGSRWEVRPSRRACLGLRLQERRQPAKRLCPGVPQRLARNVRGLRFRRSEHGRRPSRVEHRRAPGPVPDESSVRDGSGASCGPTTPRRGRTR